MKEKRDLISISDLSNEEIEEILKAAEEMEQIHEKIRQDRPLASSPHRLIDLCQGKLLATLFYEPSTRTRLSFESAMHRLGGNVIGFAEPMSSSVAKGETIADTARIISGYSDLIVIRHSLAGAAKVTADYAEVPVINGGDDSREHPTQTLCDLYTIQKHKGKVEGLKVGLCGDLRFGRTVHSLAYALARFGAEIICISPEQLKMPDYVIYNLQNRYQAKVSTSDSLSESLDKLDVLYITRIQTERFPKDLDFAQIAKGYVVDANLLRRAKDETVILHPLPRVSEIAYEVDSDVRALYFRQAANGVFVRMALIAMMLGTYKYKASLESRPDPKGAPEAVEISEMRCGNPSCVTLHESYLKPKYLVLSEHPKLLSCVYCDQLIRADGGIKNR